MKSKKVPARRKSRPPRVACIGLDQNVLTEVRETLAARGVEGAEAQRFTELSAPEDHRLVIVDYGRLPASDRTAVIDLAGRSPQLPVLLVCDQELRRDCAALLGEAKISNLLGRSQPFFPDELALTLAALLSGTPFTAEQCFDPGCARRQSDVLRASQKSSVLEQARSHAEAAGANRRVIDLFCTVAEELFTNAVFNAPVDAQGKHRFAHLPRSSEVELLPQEAVTVRLLADPRRLAISVKDPFGSLTRDKVLGYLAKCARRGADQIDRKQGGAGLGLFTVLESVSHFVVRIAPGRMTEMIGLLNLSDSYREFANWSKSFNLFLE